MALTAGLFTAREQLWLDFRPPNPTVNSDGEGPNCSLTSGSSVTVCWYGKNIKVLIAEDHDVVREGLKILIGTDPGLVIADAPSIRLDGTRGGP
jgi:hypothetical protein